MTKTKTHLEQYDGKKMPIVGYGMWQSDDPELLEKGLDKALEVGYRHFDTAFQYGNEDVFGRVLNRWFSTGKIKREELFIVTKLPVYGSNKDRVEFFLKLSLEKLQLDYVDLYLIHQPACAQVDETQVGPLYDSAGNVVIDTSSTLEELWAAMEAQVKAGRAKSIGLSNFSESQVERIVKAAKIKPANIQVELNAFYPKKGLRDLCKKLGLTVVAFAPLGSPGRRATYTDPKKVQIPELLDNPIVLDIGKKFKKTPAQIILKFLIQQDVAVIPKSVTPSRIEENYNLFDFELDDDSLDKLRTLDTGKSGTWHFDWLNYLPGLDTHPEFQLHE